MINRSLFPTLCSNLAAMRNTWGRKLFFKIWGWPGLSLKDSDFTALGWEAGAAVSGDSNVRPKLRGSVKYTFFCKVKFFLVIPSHPCIISRISGKIKLHFKSAIWGLKRQEAAFLFRKVYKSIWRADSTGKNWPRVWEWPWRTVRWDWVADWRQLTRCCPLLKKLQGYF